VFDAVVRKYGCLPDVDVSAMLMQPGTPWSNAYFGNDRGALISTVDMDRYFTRLGLSGRAAKERVIEEQEPETPGF
jgi:hypothetical protein